MLFEIAPEDAEALLAQFSPLGRVTHESLYSLKDFKRAVAVGEWDAIIAEFTLPKHKALQALTLVREYPRDLPFIVLSGKGGEDQAVTVMKAGADLYLHKNNLARLPHLLDIALQDAAKRHERHLADISIRQGKAELEGVFDSVSDLIVLTDMGDRIVRCNRKTAEHLGIPYQEIIGCLAENLFFGDTPPENNPFHSPGLFPAGNEKEVFFDRLGSWFTVACTHLNAPDATRLGLIYTLSDISRRKQVEEEKQVTDRELLTLYAVAFRLTNQAGSRKVFEDILFQIHNMLQIDVSCIHLFQGESLELVASMGSALQHQELFSGLRAEDLSSGEVLLGKPLVSGSLVNGVPLKLQRVIEELQIASWCIVPLRLSQEVIGTLFVAYRDARLFSGRNVFLLSSIARQLAVLVENRMLYDQMKEKADELQASRQELAENLTRVQEANQELKRLNAAKNNFIGMASHELKTPITSVLGGMQFLLHYCGLPLTAEQKSIFSSVYEGVQQLKSLVEDLLSISRIETKGYALKRKSINLLRLAHELTESFTLPLSTRNMTIQIEGEEVEVTADESFCRLVVRNLLENAIKFTPDGGSITVCGKLVHRDALLSLKPAISRVYPEFPVNLPASTRYYRFDVTDTGIGIPEEELGRIFEKFYGLGDIAYHFSGKTEYLAKGSGLGLSIVKGVVDAHGGMVWVTAGENGVGSRFSLVLPLMVPVERDADVS